MVQIVLSHDVDRTKKTYQSVTHGLKSLKKLEFNDFLFHVKTFQNKSVYWNFEDIIEIENSFDVKSTFYFLIESIPFNLFDISNWPLSLGRYDIYEERIISMMKFLDKNGWEVGLHGSYLSYNNKELLKKEKNILESILEKEVIGIRQHYLNLNDNTWSFQREIGFKYDASFGYIDDIGFKDKKYNFFKPFNDNFIEFPLTIMDINFVNDTKKWEKLEKIYNESEENNGIISLNWHPDNFNIIEFPEFRSDYIKLIEYFMNKGCQFKTFSEIYNQENN